MPVTSADQAAQFVSVKVNYNEASKQRSRREKKVELLDPESEEENDTEERQVRKNYDIWQDHGTCHGSLRRKCRHTGHYSVCFITCFKMSIQTCNFSEFLTHPIVTAGPYFF